MTDSAVASAQATQQTPAVEEVHVLWLSAGLGCDGDTIAITAATQPSIEDIVMGVIPGIPKVHFHNQVLAYQNGDEFLQLFYDAVEGNLGHFVLIVEGSIPPTLPTLSSKYWKLVS